MLTKLKLRLKKQSVEAIQYLPSTDCIELLQWMGVGPEDKFKPVRFEGGAILILTWDGVKAARVGDFIVKADTAADGVLFDVYDKDEVHLIFDVESV